MILMMVLCVSLWEGGEAGGEGSLLSEGDEADEAAVIRLAMRDRGRKNAPGPGRWPCEKAEGAGGVVQGEGDEVFCLCWYGHAWSFER